MKIFKKPGFEQKLRKGLDKIGNEKLYKYASERYAINVNECGSIRKFTHKTNSIRIRTIDVNLKTPSFYHGTAFDENINKYRESLISDILSIYDKVVESRKQYHELFKKLYPERIK